MYLFKIIKQHDLFDCFFFKSPVFLWSPYTIVTHNETSRYRYAWKKEYVNLRLLPRTVRGHHVYHKDQTEDVVLFLQPDRAVRAHLVHGSPGLYATSGLWRKAHTR